MAAAMKFLLVLVALVCCMQFVEMARMRRDEPATFDMAKEFEKLTKMVQDSDIMKQLKDIKPEDVQSKIQEGLKTFQGSFDENKDKLEKIAKDVVESFNKNMGTKA